MPTFASILDGRVRAPNSLQKTLIDIRTMMLKTTNTLIEHARKEKLNKIISCEVIAIAGYDLEKEEPIISNQGSLHLQDDQNFDQLGFYIVTMTEIQEKIEKPFDINKESDLGSLNQIEDKKVNRFVDQYLEGVQYHSQRYTRVTIFIEKGNSDVETKTTRYCFLQWGPQAMASPSLSSIFSLSFFMKYLSGVVVIFFLLLIYFCKDHFVAFIRDAFDL